MGSGTPESHKILFGLNPIIINLGFSVWVVKIESVTSCQYKKLISQIFPAQERRHQAHPLVSGELLILLDHTPLYLVLCRWAIMCVPTYHQRPYIVPCLAKEPHVSDPWVQTCPTALFHALTESPGHSPAKNPWSHLFRHLPLTSSPHLIAF
jgi:hypothetical protein